MTSLVDIPFNLCSGFSDVVVVCTNQLGGEQFHNLLFLEHCIGEAKCCNRVLPWQQGIITVCIYLNLRGGVCWAEWQHLWGPGWWINQISNSHTSHVYFPLCWEILHKLQLWIWKTVLQTQGFGVRGRVVLWLYHIQGSVRRAMGGCHGYGMWNLMPVWTEAVPAIMRETFSD